MLRRERMCQGMCRFQTVLFERADFDAHALDFQTAYIQLARFRQQPQLILAQYQPALRQLFYQIGNHLLGCLKLLLFFFAVCFL